MTTFQVIRRELVYVDRVYEVEADSYHAAMTAVRQGAGEIVDEQPQDTYRADRVISVADENGNEVWRSLAA